jgi:hypothetical protein
MRRQWIFLHHVCRTAGGPASEVSPLPTTQSRSGCGRGLRLRSAFAMEPLVYRAIVGDLPGRGGGPGDQGCSEGASAPRRPRASAGARRARRGARAASTEPGDDGARETRPLRNPRGSRSHAGSNPFTHAKWRLPVPAAGRGVDLIEVGRSLPRAAWSRCRARMELAGCDFLASREAVDGDDRTLRWRGSSARRCGQAGAWSRASSVLRPPMGPFRITVSLACCT